MIRKLALTALTVVCGIAVGAAPAHAAAVADVSVSFSTGTKVTSLLGITAHGTYTCHNDANVTKVKLDVMLRQGNRFGAGTANVGCGVEDAAWEVFVPMIGAEKGVGVHGIAMVSLEGIAADARAEGNLVDETFFVATGGGAKLQDDGTVAVHGTYACSLSGGPSVLHTVQIVQEIGGALVTGHATTTLPCVVEGTWSVSVLPDAGTFNDAFGAHYTSTVYVGDARWENSAELRLH